MAGRQLLKSACRARSVSHSELDMRLTLQGMPTEVANGLIPSCRLQSVGRGNLEEFMAYGFYNAAWEALGGDTQRQIRVFLERVEAAWGVRIAHEGRNPDVTFMRHLWEPLRRAYFYACVKNDGGSSQNEMVCSSSDDSNHQTREHLTCTPILAFSCGSRVYSGVQRPLSHAQDVPTAADFRAADGISAHRLPGRHVASGVHGSGRAYGCELVHCWKGRIQGEHEQKQSLYEPFLVCRRCASQRILWYSSVHRSRSCLALNPCTSFTIGLPALHSGRGRLLREAACGPCSRAAVHGRLELEAASRQAKTVV